MMTKEETLSDKIELMSVEWQIDEVEAILKTNVREAVKKLKKIGRTKLSDKNGNFAYVLSEKDLNEIFGEELI